MPWTSLWTCHPLFPGLPRASLDPTAGFYLLWPLCCQWFEASSRSSSRGSVLSLFDCCCRPSRPLCCRPPWLPAFHPPLGTSIQCTHAACAAVTETCTQRQDLDYHRLRWCPMDISSCVFIKIENVSISCRVRCSLLPVYIAWFRARYQLVMSRIASLHSAQFSIYFGHLFPCIHACWLVTATVTVIHMSRSLNDCSVFLIC